MDCTQTTWLSTEEYLRQFNRRTEELRIPISGSLELTRRCNLRCLHCYCAVQNPPRETSLEMTTQEILSLIDEIADAGCLNILITGGEPFLRKDFPEIYRYLKWKGMLITVFTNATMVSDQILGLFREFPPKGIEITLYGATAPTYESITRIPGSYRKCIEGIKNFIDHNIPIAVKTVLMTANLHEFDAIEGMAKNFGVKFRFDAAIFPRFNGDTSPVGLRVPPEDAVDKEFSDPERCSEWIRFSTKYGDPPPLESLYQCSAGITQFHIDPYGNLHPCLMPTGAAFSVRDGGFMEGWNSAIPEMLQRHPSPDFRCRTCICRAVCAYCPAFFGLENGSENEHSEYLCRMGRYRYASIHNQLFKEGGSHG